MVQTRSQLENLSKEELIDELISVEDISFKLSDHTSRFDNFLRRYELVKVLDQNPEQWPYKIDDVLFAHRVSRHASTNYPLFYLMYNREPVLPINLKYGLNSEPASSYNGPFDQDMFEAVFASANTILVDIHEAARRNIKKAQEKQKRDFDRRYLSSTNVKVVGG